MTLKNGFRKCSLFVFIKTWPLRFPAKENPNMEKALFDWPIVLQYDVKAKYRLISRKFSGMKFFSKATRVCIRSINQSNRSISVRLLFLFCSRVFIPRSFENRSISRGVLNQVLYDEAPSQGPTPYPVTDHFWLKRYPSRIPFIDKW